MTRYAVSAAMAGNAAAFDARVTEVVKCWRGLQQAIVFRPLAVALLAAHARLKDAGELSYASFERQRNADRDEALAGLEAKIKDIAASTPAVLRSMVSWLQREYHDLIGEATIASPLASHQVTVIDHPWVLPARPSRLSGLAAHLDTLDLRLAAETVFGTSAVRDEASGSMRGSSSPRESGSPRRGWRRRRRSWVSVRLMAGRRRTSMSSRSCSNAPTAASWTLLLWQLIEVLEPQVTEGLPNRSVVSLASGLGLDRAEAAVLVLTLTQQRFRQSRHRCGCAQAASERGGAAGDTEEAAALLAELIDSHGDGDGSLESRLRSLPPPPPAHVLATPQEDTVRVEWKPAPTQVSTSGTAWSAAAAGRGIAVGRADGGRDGRPECCRSGGAQRRAPALHRVLRPGARTPGRGNVGRRGT